MSEFEINERGVPQYPKGHAGRLLATLAAIDLLADATAIRIAEYTGLSKGNIDTYVKVLNTQLGTSIVKEGSAYKIHEWGSVLQKNGVRKYLIRSDK